MLTINVENGSKIAKKISPEENLTSLRKLLKDKITESHIFSSKDGAEVDFEDENETKINDIIEGKNIYMKIKKDPNETPVEIYINNILKYKKDISKKTELSVIRKSLPEIMNDETYFLNEEGAEIDINDEKETILEDILDENKLNIKDKSMTPAPKPIGMENETDETSSSEDNINEEKKLFEFYLDEELICNKKVLNTEKLVDIRKKLSSKISEEFDFISKENNKIPESDENNLKLYKIIKDKNKIYLKSDKKSNNKDSLNLIEIFLNDKLFLNKKLNILEGLPKIRKTLGDKMPKDSQFIFPNGLKIDIEEEDEYILQDIINKNRLNLFCDNLKLNQKNLEENNNKNLNISKANISTTQDNYINTPLNGSEFLKQEGGVKIYSYPIYDFTPEEEKKSIKIMVIGPTGTGKTTLLNSYINYLMKIQYNDDFRYKIINENFNRGQSESQTKDVTNYNIRTPEGKLYQIIDTPGFGDTVGIQEDEKITMKITDFFLHKLNEINAVCLVIKSSDNRLTACQKYIFNCVFDLFGEDTKDIFIAMLTFCDGGKPQALASLLDKSCLFSKMIKNKDNDWYFKFNNSAIFEKDTEDILNLTYWNIGMDSFHKFTEKLNTLPKVTLDQTKTVLNERSRLTKNVEILSKKLKDGLNKAETIKGYFKMISELKGDLNDSRNYTKVIKVPKTKKVPVTEKGRYMTTCLICNKTCHVGCYIKDDDDKSGCACIKNNYCVVCKNKCHWSEHKNRPYELVDYMDDETITLNDLKNKYYNSKNQLDAKTQILMGAKNDLIKLNLECMQTQQEMMNSVNRLKEIALNKSVFESVEEHIDELILNEKNQHTDGWQNRVQGLQVMKEQKKKLREISQGKNDDFEQIKKVIEESISNEEDLKKFILSMDDGSVKGDKCFIF